MHFQFEDVALGEVIVTEPEPGTPTYLQLTSVPIGTHRLRVSQKRFANSSDESIGFIDVIIREPKVWTMGLSDKGAVSVVCEPNKPTLEQVAEGHFTIEIQGPEGRQANVVLELSSNDADTVSSQ